MQGYKDRDLEFGNTLRRIINLNYGLIVTCHTKTTVIDSKNDIDISAIAPDLDKRCIPIISGLVDLMGMITKTWNEETQSWDRWLLTKATPTVSAGSRIKYLPEKIPFGYKYLEEAIKNAILEAQENGAKVVSSEKEEVAGPTYQELMARAQDLWIKLVGKDEDFNEEMAARIMKRVELIFGHQIRISEITESQRDLLELVVTEMEELNK